MRFGQIFGNWRVYVLVLFKMIAVPLLAHFALRQVLDNERILCVLTVLLCMPIATNTTILSYQYGADCLLRRVCQYASLHADDPSDDEAAVRNVRGDSAQEARFYVPAVCARRAA